jgi:signal transduction histidine kinase
LTQPEAPAFPGEDPRPLVASRYLKGLRGHLDGRADGALEHAYRVGRFGIAMNLGVLDMAIIHRQAVDALLARAPSADAARALTRKAEEYFSECLAAFEMVHRGYRETLDELRRLNQELARVLRARSAFLAEASRRLAATLDYDATLRAIVELPVAELADWCVLELLDKEMIHRVAVAHVEPELARRVEQRARGPRPLAGAPQAIQEVLRSRRSRLFAPLGDEGLALVAGETEAQTFRELGAGSVMLAPLEARGHALGAIQLGSREPGRHGQDDLLLCEELARRASMALDNAWLYREAQRAIEIRDSFMSIASHELKGPLAPLMLKLELAEQRLRAGKPVELQTMETSRRQVERLRDLIDDLLDSTRIETGKLELKLEPLELGELLREQVASFQTAMPKRSIELRIEHPAPVHGDPARLAQVITNLLENALKYSPEEAPVELRLRREQHEAVLTVADRGIGIPEPQQKLLFGRFFRAANAAAVAKGLGLGLFICREIVLRHAGRIWVESEEGRGSRFFVALPLDATSTTRRRT